MSERRSLASGDVLADRYELHDLVAEKLGGTFWRAHDAILHRNVRLELLPSADPRADHFLEAARTSTQVSDPRFLRILDVIADDHGHHVVVREWARAFGLDALLQESPLPNQRAAEVVAEVAEAMAHAHARGVFHRRLAPHHVLLKQSGAVRIVGLGVAAALAPIDRPESSADLAAYERLDVEAMGKLLYACLTSRWPGGEVDGLRAAPREHGRLMQAHQVRAGVSRELDSICTRILGAVPSVLTARELAAELRTTGGGRRPPGDSRDLSRVDPVIVPHGPPPGLAPPRPRPKAFEPPPPTPVERSLARAKDATRGDRKLVLIGIVGTLLLASAVAFLVGRATVSPHVVPTPTPAAHVGELDIATAIDFDPQGEDRQEDPDHAAQAIDGDPDSAWTTSTYFRNRHLGGLKPGVGLILDLGGPRQVHTLRLLLSGPTDVVVYASEPGEASVPARLADLTRVTVAARVGPDASITFADPVDTRFLLIWLTGLPPVGSGEYRAEVREVQARGSD